MCCHHAWALSLAFSSLLRPALTGAPRSGSKSPRGRASPLQWSLLLLPLALVCGCKSKEPPKPKTPFEQLADTMSRRVKGFCVPVDGELTSTESTLSADGESGIVRLVVDYPGVGLVDGCQDTWTVGCTGSNGSPWHVVQVRLEIDTDYPIGVSPTHIPDDVRDDEQATHEAVYESRKAIAGLLGFWEDLEGIGTPYSVEVNARW